MKNKPLIAVDVLIVAGIFCIGFIAGVVCSPSPGEQQAITYLARMSVPTGDCEPTKRWWKTYIYEHIGREEQCTAPSQEEIIATEWFLKGGK